jgi:GMP synthase (glutamine-hydrolysing)
MKKLLIVLHEEQTSGGSTLAWANSRNISLEMWHAFREPKVPEISADMGVLICGGSMDTYEDDKHPWLKIEKKFIAELVQHKIKTFGICLGCQLLAESLGSRVFKNDKGWEIGFHPLKDARGEMVPVFQWHQFTYTLPLNAELVMRGDFCAHQAFKMGQHIFGTQFHPESTEEWIKNSATEVEPWHKGHVQTERQILDGLSQQKDLQAWYFRQLDQFFLNK